LTFRAVDFIGVDMGVANIAVTSDGDVWANDPIEAQRVWYANRKALLQRVGTKSAKRRLKQLSGKECRFKRDVDHCLSKDIVANAERTGRGIAVEELTGIHERARAIRKAQRPRVCQVLCVNRSPH
jgi:transposase